MGLHALASKAAASNAEAAGAELITLMEASMSAYAPFA